MAPKPPSEGAPQASQVEKRDAEDAVPPSGAPQASQVEQIEDNYVVVLPRPPEYHVFDNFDELPDCTMLPTMQ